MRKPLEITPNIISAMSGKKRATAPKQTQAIWIFAVPVGNYIVYIKRLKG
ncbi:MAG: hypothetical protein L6V93_19335 [Clostridiales bacterium]|nr:MAG: hypothetical protein L6V93_19335 [Clostridiales bacterium]